MYNVPVLKKIFAAQTEEQAGGSCIGPLPEHFAEVFIITETSLAPNELEYHTSEYQPSFQGARLPFITPLLNGQHVRSSHQEKWGH